MLKSESKKWRHFHKTRVRTNQFPKYPQEIMLRTIFGKYNDFKINLTKSSNVIDVGCGFGNNLIPFLDLGAKVYGVEIDNDICQIAKKILKKKFPNKKIDIKIGHNRFIPFKNNFFDLLTTNTLHYEGSLENVHKALKEYSGNKEKIFHITTTGNKNIFFKQTKKISKNIFQIRNKTDIRFGKNFFFFENEKYFKKILSKYFSKIIIGRETTTINGNCSDYFMALCQK